MPASGLPTAGAASPPQSASVLNNSNRHLHSGFTTSLASSPFFIVAAAAGANTPLRIVVQQLRPGWVDTNWVGEHKLLSLLCKGGFGRSWQGQEQAQCQQLRHSRWAGSGPTHTSRLCTVALHRSQLLTGCAVEAELVQTELLAPTNNPNASPTQPLTSGDGAAEVGLVQAEHLALLRGGVEGLVGALHPRRKPAAVS